MKLINEYILNVVRRRSQDLPSGFRVGG